MRFEFLTANHLVFGPGTLKEAGKHAKEWGRKALVVHGSDPSRAARLISLLNEAHITTREFSITGEPTVEAVVIGAGMARDWGADMVIGIGGGSVIDAAKAIAGLMRNEDPVEDYLEVVGKGLPLELPAAPWIAIPTTAGTGAEATKNAVLTVPSRNLKVSLRSPHLLAPLAIIDPELALGTPPAVTAATGMDALCQLIEAYVCTRANPMTDALCAAGIPKAALALPAAYADPHALAPRCVMALGALWSGMALANAGLGAVHGFASPLGGLLGAPHGALCGTLLAPVTAANIAALRARGQDCSRFDQLARWLTGDALAKADQASEFLAALSHTLALPGLASLGLTEALIPDVCERALQASSMKANPVALTADELAAILRSAL